MPIIEKVMVETWKIAVRNLGGTQTSTPVEATLVSSTTSPSPSATGNTTNGGNTSQSPLLFFVALGFGVVFTNLWIIVGVKYCFRYNARNRALARGEDGEPINLEPMPRHRRRREKKLMTMDDVNERFPMMKYKNWVAARAEEGLPTAGGVATVPSSRAASLRDADGSIPSSPITSKHSEDRPTTSSPEINVSSVTNVLGGSMPEDVQKGLEGPAEKKVNGHVMATLTEIDTIATNERKSEEEDDEEDHIHGALPPEMVTNPGDTCAICIDTLEPDDDVRGLTCGHAFHAGCLDPWLTGRRACCPLCKADYFVPKPRPEGEVPEAERPRRNTMGRMNLPSQPRTAWIGVRGPRGMMLPGRLMVGQYDAASQARVRRDRRPRPTAESNTLEPQETIATTATGETVPPTSNSLATRMRNPFSRMHMPSMHLPGRHRPNETAQEVGTADPTPGQLESGVVR